MFSPAGIHFLRHHQIDKNRWDERISTAVNGLIYARTFYLDHIAPGWSALAGVDYEWVMPLPTRRKWTISYLYQPAFTQQLGVFAKAGVSIPYQEILKYLQQQYSFCEINWNYGLELTPSEPAVITIAPATNYIIDLAAGYPTISASYRTGLLKSLQDHRSSGVVYQTGNPRRCVELYRQYYGSRMRHVSSRDYANFCAICSYANQHNLLVCREAVNSAGAVLAAALLFRDDRRMYNVINITTSAGRLQLANHFLLDSILREFEGQHMLFDFEGSDLPGVKSFYRSFGAKNQPYYHVKFNLLPWPLTVLKQ